MQSLAQVLTGATKVQAQEMALVLVALSRRSEFMRKMRAVSKNMPILKIKTSGIDLRWKTV